MRSVASIAATKKKWQIGLEKLQEKTGSNAPLKKFRLNIRQIIADDHMPFYRMELAENDLVIFCPRSAKTALTPSITLPDWAEEQGREIAREKRWDYYALRSKWLKMATKEAGKGNSTQNIGAAFIGYCKKQKVFR